MQRQLFCAFSAAFFGASVAAIPAASSAQTPSAQTPSAPTPSAPAEPSGAPVVDAPVRLGQLPNGLHYAIVPRRSNDAGVVLFIRVNGGFFGEQRPGERGVAHLIEHLIFRSPVEAAPDDRFRFRNIGMPLTYPEPAGGTTSWRESDYYLVARTNNPADIDALLNLFRGSFSDLHFRADIVDEQRTEVMQEMADKKRGNVIYADYIKAVAPGSPGDIIEAQNSDDVPSASLETIRALYHRFYRPENVAITIVGDVDPAQIEALVAKRFGDWRGTGEAPQPITTPHFLGPNIAPISYAGAQDGRQSAIITSALPLPNRAATREQRIEARLMDMIVMRVMNNRLAQTQTGGAPGKYGIFIENGEQGHRLIMVWDNFEQGKWQPALAGLKKATCDASVTGFSGPEWRDAKAFVLQDLEARAAGMNNFDIARQSADMLTIDGTVVPPAAFLADAKKLLPEIDEAKGDLWWQQQWDGGTQHIRVETPDLQQTKQPLTTIRAVAAKATSNRQCKVRKR